MNMHKQQKGEILTGILALMGLLIAASSLFVVLNSKQSKQIEQNFGAQTLRVSQGGSGDNEFSSTTEDGATLLAADGTNKFTGTSSPTVGWVIATTTGTASIFQNLTVLGTCTGCGTAAAVDLQDTYNNSSVDAQITTADAKDIIFALTDTATDPHFILSVASDAQGQLQMALGSTTTGVWEGYGRLGISTSTPGTGLAVQATSTLLGGEVYIYGQLTLPYLVSTSTTATSTIGLLNVDNDLQTGDLAVVNQATFGGRIEVLGSATSSIPSLFTSDNILVADLRVSGQNSFDGRLEVLGTATSTIPAILLSGNLATPNIKVTGQSSFDGRLEVLGSATSSFAGGLAVQTVGGLSTASGLTLTGGNLEGSTVGGRLLNLGIGSTSPSAILGVVGTSHLAGTTTATGIVADLLRLKGSVEIPVQTKTVAALELDGQNLNYVIPELTADVNITYDPDSYRNGSTINLLVYNKNSQFQLNFASSTASINILWLNSKSTTSPPITLEGANLCQFFSVSTSSVPSLFASCTGEGYTK